MRFVESAVAGAFVVELEPLQDERGFFARQWCSEEFGRRGLAAAWVQMNVSRSVAAGTMRGLHFQRAPWSEAKLVRCLRGALYDVVLDLRADSPTRGRWAAAELTEENHHAMYVPPGCAHGFLTLRESAEAMYLVSAAYQPGAEGGVRWDDPQFGIVWPREVASISEKDRRWQDFGGEWQ
jgi:dTDP-4-dehydrorhamnose 3,5-epimerase